MKEFFVYAYFLSVICGCSLYINIEGKKKEICVEEKKEVKVKPKTRYETLKEEHNKEWLNLPHRESENELFQPK